MRLIHAISASNNDRHRDFERWTGPQGLLDVLGAHPAVGHTRDAVQRPLPDVLAIRGRGRVRGDSDRAGILHRLGLDEGVLVAVPLALDADPVLAPEATHDVDVLLQAGGAFEADSPAFDVTM